MSTEPLCSSGSQVGSQRNATSISFVVRRILKAKGHCFQTGRSRREALTLPRRTSGGAQSGHVSISFRAARYPSCFRKLRRQQLKKLKRHRGGQKGCEVQHPQLKNNKQPSVILWTLRAWEKRLANEWTRLFAHCASSLSQRAFTVSLEELPTSRPRRSE